MVQEGTELLLVRHGETEWNVQGGCRARPTLRSRRWARPTLSTRDRLARGSRMPCVCYTSPLGRARKTAEILCAGTSIPIVDDDGLVSAFGVLEGLTVEERKARISGRQTEVAGRRLRAAGRREPLVDAGRAVAALKAIAERHPRARLVVTHSGWLVGDASGARHAVQRRQGRRAALPNTAINLLRWEGAGWQVQLWGERGELASARCGASASRPSWGLRSRWARRSRCSCGARWR